MLYELQHEQNDGDQQDDVDQAAGDAKGQSTTPENQKDDGDNEEHIQKSALKTLVVAWQQSPSRLPGGLLACHGKSDRQRSSIMAKTPAEMKASMIAGLPEKTGKSLPEWLQIVQASKLAKHKEIVTLLKSGHKLTHGFANMIALQALNSDSHTESDTDSLVDGQYAGAKAGLRPIYEAILTVVGKFGTDVEVSPKKGYVSLRRNKQFAIVQPSSSSRLDVGINLKDVEPTNRLEASGSFNAMLSHRVRLSKQADVDKELIRWLKSAYEQS